MANRRFNQFYYTFHNKPVQLDCKFAVAAADTGGLGITGLKGGGIANVYMHTSATPAAGNPNPAAGYIYVQLQDNYSQYYFGDVQVAAPVTGSAISISGSTVLTVGVPYVITSLGTTTVAQWQAAGVPVGIVPAIGLVFFAKITGGGTGTGQVKAVGISGIDKVELCGSPTQTISSPIAAIVGGVSQASYLIFQCLAATDASTTTLIPKAPADGTAFHMSFVLSSSSIKVQGD